MDRVGRTVIGAWSLSRSSRSSCAALSAAAAASRASLSRARSRRNRASAWASTSFIAASAALAEVFQSNQVMMLLNLESNLIEEEGGKAILALLKSNTSALEILYIENNNLPKWIEEEVAEENR